ncbi:MAG TPA: GNAT family N-acetyltransferase [Candidatus Limnocylindrales bacterium]
MSAPTTFTLRHATEDDHAVIADVVDHWFGGKRVAAHAGRTWFRHFGGTSWVAVGDERRPRGFLLGFVSADRPGEGVIQLIGVDPRHRRRGVGRSLVDAFVEEAEAGGCRLVTAVAWPDEPIALAFFRGLGFEPDDGPGTQRLFGVPAYPSWDGPGEDRAVLRRWIGPADTQTER